MAHPGSTERDFSLLRVVALTAFAVAASIGIMALFFKDLTPVYRENGILETGSVVIWLTSAALSFGLAFKCARDEDRSFAVLLGLLAMLAALRELDAQIWLNPQRLGAYGVRYRIDWWLNGSVPFWLKLGWGLLFLLLFLAFTVPVIRLWRSGFKLMTSGDRLLPLLAISFAFLAMGFVIDDLMRGAKLLSLNNRQLLEEASEFTGAALFLFTVMRHLRYPWSARVRGVEA